MGQMSPRQNRLVGGSDLKANPLSQWPKPEPHTYRPDHRIGIGWGGTVGSVSSGRLRTRCSM